MVWRCIPLLLFYLHLTSHFSLGAASLYNSTDNVVILESGNFSSVVYGSESAWIIEFYNSWCGHCISFAPLWKQFGRDVRDWEHTVRVGVLDCSVDDNMPLCRQYEIMAYPTIKMFAAKLSQEDVGTNLGQMSTVEEIGNGLIDFLLEKQRAKNGSSTWVKLQPYHETISDLWGEAPSTVDHILVIVDTAKSHRALGTVLDLGGYSSIYIRYKEAQEKDTKRYGGTAFPVLIISNKQGAEEVIITNGKTRKELAELIMNKFSLNRGMLPYKTALLGGKGKLKKDDMEGAGDGQPEEINSDILNYEDDLPDTAFSGTERQDQVYMVDVENAVSYALRHEVAQHKSITGDTLINLQNFLDVLVRYLPSRPSVHNFLLKLHRFTLNNGNKIEGQQFQEAIESLQSIDSVLPDHQPWIGCLGSDSKFRGYPCGLWTTFHVLTVNAVLQDGNKKYYNPKKTLRAIHGYVKDFFGCSYCSQHFQEMYAVDAESFVNVADDGILWLWKGHNKVNKRLKGDESEDPAHPKQQFPPKSFCSSCWDEDNFKEKEVLTYLKSIYAKRALSFKGTQAITPVKNRQVKVIEQVEEYKRVKNQAETLVVLQQRLTSSVQKVRMPSSWGFNSVDISLCVFLYGISTVIIMSVYCMVLIKRKMRRRKFLEAYKLPWNAMDQQMEYSPVSPKC